MISKIVRCAARSPLHALVFAPLLALAVLGAGGTPSVAAQEADEAERNATAAESAGEDPDAPGSPRFLGSAIEWNLGDAESATVTISHPDGRVTRHEFGPGEVPRIEFDARPSPGDYAWEIVGTPPAGQQGPAIGGFIKGGFLEVNREGALSLAGGLFDARPMETTPAAPERDFAVDGEGRFQGGLCSGRKCGTFHFDGGSLHLTDTTQGATIWFWDERPGGGALDTGATWRMTTGPTTFLLSRAGGPAAGASLILKSQATLLTGRIGVNSNTPAKDLHINTSGSPTIRLERNASGGGTARIWDIGAAATNFFIGDNASRFPFQIQPGTPTGTLFLASSGRVGVGADAPGAKLHVYGSDGATSETIEEASASSALRTLLNLRNRGGTRTLYDDTAIPQSWSVGTQNTGFVIDELAHAGFELLIEDNGNVTVGQDAFVGRDLDVARHARVGGNLTVLGQLIQPSSRALKRDFAPIDAQAVLDLVVAMPVSTWSYNSDASVRHMGPVAEDFHAAFGLGGTDKGIATVDSDGVALAAIQGLHRRVEEENAELRRRIQVLEEMVLRLARAQQP